MNEVNCILNEKKQFGIETGKSSAKCINKYSNNYFRYILKSDSRKNLQMWWRLQKLKEKEKDSGWFFLCFKTISKSVPDSMH